MSKSKGNVVAPDKIAKEFGVEILRLWVGLSDYSGDLKISNDILKQNAEQYRKIRNTIRFLLANINDLNTNLNEAKKAKEAAKAPAATKKASAKKAPKEEKPAKKRTGKKAAAEESKVEA